MQYLIDVIQAVGYFGYFLLFITVFFESFPLTFFLPGDSLLFTTGFLASQGHFNLGILIPTLFVASVLGYILSYFVGKKIGQSLFVDKNSFWFNPKHIVAADKFFKKYGSRTIIIGRFVPIVRSFGPAIAGAVDMRYKKFIIYTLVGSTLWVGGVTLLGFYLGRLIPNAHLYLTPIVLGIIFVSILPTIIEYIYNRKENNTSSAQIPER